MAVALVRTFHISVLDALYNMQWARERVSGETVANCFLHSSQPSNLEDAETNADEGESIEEFFQTLQEKTVINITPEEYVAFDMDVETTAEMLISDIINTISDTKEPESDEEACETETESTPEPDVSTDEAKAALQQLLKYAQQHEQ